LSSPEVTSRADRRRYLLWRTLGTLLELLPVTVAVRLAEALGWTASFISSSARHDVRGNLRRITEYGSDEPIDDAVLTRLVRRSYASYGRYWAEGATLPGLSAAEAASRISFIEGIEHLHEAMAAGHGAIVALPHIGSWEWGGALCAYLGYPMTAIAERLEPPELFEWFVTKRGEMGLLIEPLDEEAGKKILRVLKGGGLVGLLCDRDLEGDGIEVELLGARTTVPAGPATLALRTGAALMTGVIYSGPGAHHSVVLSTPISTDRQGRLREDVTRVTQEIADQLSGLIRRAPEQWHVFSDPFAPVEEP